MEWTNNLPNNFSQFSTLDDFFKHWSVCSTSVSPTRHKQANKDHSFNPQLLPKPAGLLRHLKTLQSTYISSVKKHRKLVKDTNTRALSPSSFYGPFHWKKSGKLVQKKYKITPTKPTACSIADFNGRRMQSPGYMTAKNAGTVSTFGGKSKDFSSKFYIKLWANRKPMDDPTFKLVG